MGEEVKKGVEEEEEGFVVEEGGEGGDKKVVGGIVIKGGDVKFVWVKGGLGIFLEMGRYGVDEVMSRGGFDGWRGCGDIRFLEVGVEEIDDGKERDGVFDGEDVENRFFRVLLNLGVMVGGEGE